MPSVFKIQQGASDEEAAGSTAAPAKENKGSDENKEKAAKKDESAQKEAQEKGEKEDEKSPAQQQREANAGSTVQTGK